MGEDIFNNDVETILTGKVAFHKEQAKYHSRMAKETAEKLEMLVKMAPAAPEVPQLTMVHNSANIEKLSTTIWRPKVENVLKESPVPLKSEDILRKIDESYLKDENLRKKAINVISSALFYLVQHGKVTKTDSPGKGYLYAIAG